MKTLEIQAPDNLVEFIPRFLVSSTETHKLAVIPVATEELPKNPFYCAGICSQIIHHFMRDISAENKNVFFMEFISALQLILQEYAKYEHQITPSDENRNN